MENNENKAESPEITQEVVPEESPQTETAEQPAAVQQHSADPADNPEVNPADNPEVKKLIEEAEHRGYLRGRNENIEGFIAKNFDDMPFASDDDCISEPCPAFLSHIRPGFWE